MGTGLFAVHARTVFLSDTTIIRYHGDEEIGGHPAARYDFRVPQAWSGYQIQANGTSAIVGTKGSFWIDPTSLELIRMEVQADEIPAMLGIESSVARIDYARMRIGDSDVLLPQSAQLETVRSSGDAWRNSMEFSHCRGYRAESSIRFDMPETSPQSVPTPARLLDLPAGLTVPIELQTAIDSTTAHVGDLLSGRVTEDVRRKGKGKTIVPKGAVFFSPSHFPRSMSEVNQP